MTNWPARHVATFCTTTCWKSWAVFVCKNCNSIRGDWLILLLIHNWLFLATLFSWNPPHQLWVTAIYLNVLLKTIIGPIKKKKKIYNYPLMWLLNLDVFFVRGELLFWFQNIFGRSWDRLEMPVTKLRGKHGTYHDSEAEKTSSHKLKHNKKFKHQIAHLYNSGKPECFETFGRERHWPTNCYPVRHWLKWRWFLVKW